MTTQHGITPIRCYTTRSTNNHLEGNTTQYNYCAALLIQKPLQYFNYEGAKTKATNTISRLKNLFYNLKDLRLFSTTPNSSLQLVELAVVPGVVVPGVAELVAVPKIPLNNDPKPFVNQVNNPLTPVKN
ncbi:hypothetical protein [Xylella fastidiosa]|uniref:hypothetical protein n=1 Tax=Xylella fastidiosa TaxID=2371 RepID=UPI0012BC7378|nr:hypothetical protein [Xylella fastidiosa]